MPYHLPKAPKAFVLAALTTAANAEIAPDHPVPASVLEQPAVKVLNMEIAALVGLVAKRHGLVPDVSDTVRGQVASLELSGGLDEMMQTVADKVDIDWFVFDGVLIVSAESEAATRFIALDGLPFETATQVLRDADIDESQVRLQEIASGRAARVSGPPKAVEAVEALLALTVAERRVPANAGIIVRRGTLRSIENFGQAAIPQITLETQLPDPAPPSEVEG